MQTYFKEFKNTCSKNIIGIYRITNLINGKFYIGQSKCILSRIKGHFGSLLNPREGSIQEDIKKYKKENFVVDILAECDLYELNSYEWTLIDEFKAVENGYNVMKDHKVKRLKIDELVS